MVIQQNSAEVENSLRKQSNYIPKEYEKGRIFQNQSYMEFSWKYIV